MEILVCAVTALTYLGTLEFGFVYDDNVTIVGNPSIRSFPSLFQALSSSAGFPLYRPVTTLWTCLNYALFGLKPAGWHIASLALHVLVTYLVFVIAHKLVRDRGAAFAAALLFGVHPAHVENVAWISAVNDLLMSALLLASFLAFLQFCSERGNGWLALSIGLFTAALLAKETAVVFPVLIVVFAWMFTAKSGTDWSHRAATSIRTSAAFFSVLALYLFVRSHAVRGAVASKSTDLGWTTMVFTWPSILWFDLRHLVLPTALSEFYPSEYITSPALRAFVLPAVLLVAVAAVVVFWTCRLQDAQAARFACIWIVLPLVPTLYLRALTPGDFIHDRFLYLPSVGFVILVVLVIREVPWRLAGRSRTETQFGLIVLLAAAGVVGTVANQLPWASDLLLYQNGLKFTPESSNLKDNLANTLAGVGQTDRAIRLYQEVLQRDPRFWRSNYNLGHEYLKAGKYREAETYLLRAVQIDDRDPDQFIFLAVAQWRENKLADAALNGQRAIERSPRSRGYHYILGRILDASGHRDRAISEFKLELAYHPENRTVGDDIKRLQGSR